MPYINCDEVKTLKEVSEKLDGLQRHAIDQVPWPVFSYLPDAKFSIAYTNGAILLKYYEEIEKYFVCWYWLKPFFRLRGQYQFLAIPKRRSTKRVPLVPI